MMKRVKPMLNACFRMIAGYAVGSAAIFVFGFTFLNAITVNSQTSGRANAQPEAPEVAEREVRIESTSSTAGNPVTVNVRVDAIGDESEYGFVVLYDQAILSGPVIGAGGPGGAAIRDCNTATAGVINCSVGAFPNNNPGSSSSGIGEIPSGNNQILITITFNIAPAAVPGMTPVTFRQTGDNSPPNTSNDAAQSLALTSTDGNVTIAGPSGSSRQLRVESTTGTAGQPVTVNIRVDAVGDESEYGFVVLYDQAILSGPVIGASADPNGAATRDCNTLTLGVINCSVGGFPVNNPASSSSGIGEIPAGNNQILITITFNVAANALSGVTPVTFRQTCTQPCNSPPNVSNDAASQLPITSVDGTVTISAARQLRVESTNGSAGNPVTVNIRVDAVGDETEYGFAVLYNQSILTGTPIIGAGSPGGAITRDCNTATSGVVNCSVGAFPNNNPASSNMGIGEIPSGNNQILITITWTVAPGTPNNTVTPVTFRLSGDNSPPNVSNDTAQSLPIDSQNGTVTIAGPTSATVSVGGRVTSSSGQGVSRARVELSGGSGRNRVVLTNGLGYFNFTDVAVGETYIVSVTRKGYQFDPVVVTVNQEISDMSIVAQ